MSFSISSRHSKIITIPPYLVLARHLTHYLVNLQLKNHGSAIRCILLDIGLTMISSSNTNICFTVWFRKLFYVRMIFYLYHLDYVHIKQQRQLLHQGPQYTRSSLLNHPLLTHAITMVFPQLLRKGVPRSNTFRKPTRLESQDMAAAENGENVLW